MEACSAGTEGILEAARAYMYLWRRSRLKQGRTSNAFEGLQPGSVCVSLFW